MYYVIVNKENQSHNSIKTWKVLCSFECACMAGKCASQEHWEQGGEYKDTGWCTAKDLQVLKDRNQIS